MQPKLIELQTGQLKPICVDCGAVFERSDSEIAARRGSGMAPSLRCPECREARRQVRNARVLDELRHGHLREASTPAPGPEDAAERLFPAVCSGCQRPIRLPFKPRLDRPAFCRFCMSVRSGR